MNSYIDYDYYKDTFKGELIPESEFDKFAISSSKEIDLRVIGGVDTTSPFISQVKYATCLVAEILYNQKLMKNKLVESATGGSGAITSEKVGDYSVNYASVSTSELENLCSDTTIANEINNVIELYLTNTNFLNRGINVF